MAAFEGGAFLGQVFWPSMEASATRALFFTQCDSTKGYSDTIIYGISLSRSAKT
jgi:hypothetical protein